MGRGLHSSLSSRPGISDGHLHGPWFLWALTPPVSLSFLLHDRQLMSAAGLFFSLCVRQCPSRTQKPHRYLYRESLVKRNVVWNPGESIPAGESRGQTSLAESVKRMLENTGPGTGGPVVKIPCSQSRDMWLRSPAWELRSSMRSAANDSNSNSKSTEAQLVNVAGTTPGVSSTPNWRGTHSQQDLLEMRSPKEAPRL